MNADEERVDAENQDKLLHQGETTGRAEYVEIPSLGADEMKQTVVTTATASKGENFGGGGTRDACLILLA